MRFMKIRWTLILPEPFKAYQSRVRVEAAKHSEGNHRAGGIRTQNAMVRAWKVSTT